MAPARLNPILLFAANTDVGKTVAAAALVRAAVRRSAPSAVRYIKPVQTGFPADSDARHVQAACPSIQASVLFTYALPASPHLAAIRECKPVADAALRARLNDELNAFAASTHDDALAIIETAGGVHSPSISGSLQSDVYRPFRFPVALIGDAKLGGISTTLTAYESLRIRGFDVPCIVMFDNPQYENHSIVQRNIDESTRIFTLPMPPPRANDPLTDHTGMLVYYDSAERHADPIVQHIIESHNRRIDRLDHLATNASSNLWWPFTQHKSPSAKSPAVIDSASGDTFAIYNASSKQLHNLYDACGSWWTLGVGHGNPALAKSAAYAAGRYGHVIYPEAVHEPAVRLAERLIDSAGRNWASRVFYSDDGSTAVEVALKMAFKKTIKSQNLTKPQLSVIGIEGGYHGDTIGAMDACNPNIFNEQVDWYRGRGLWFAPPAVALKNGKYHIRLPESLQHGNQPDTPQVTFDSKDAIFDIKRNDSALAKIYRSHIEAHLDKGESDLGLTYGALIIEPVLLGAGGMIWVDPLFQRELIRCVRRRKPDAPVPVIFDEVFVGMYRLGYASTGTSLLHERPDIACYAKCLTTIVPLAVTMASESIFEAFLGDTKAEALLHGHSFSAHPVGCQVALSCLDIIEKNIQARPSAKEAAASIWDADLVERVSSLPNVSGVVALGTTLAIELASAGAQGYASSAAASVVRALREPENGIYVRPLGNVLYFLASQETTPESAHKILATVVAELTKSDQPHQA